MAISWTKDQEKVINVRDRSILVSAAAGSGKTAVLSQRILSRLLDKNNKTDIDRFLVLTFTNAAAAEMKSRIYELIEGYVNDNPHDAHMRRQLSLIANAQITTIDSFCMNIVRNYFYAADIDANVKIAQGAELDLIKQDAMKDTIEAAFLENDEAFIRFAECYSPGKKDNKIENLVYDLYDFSQSHPWPKELLEECRGAYDLSNNDINSLPWYRWCDEYIRALLKSCINILNTALNISGEQGGPYKYIELLETELDEISSFLDEEDFFVMCEKVADKKGNFARLPNIRKTDDDIDADKKELVKSLRDQVKGVIGDIEKGFHFTREQESENIIAISENVGTLIDLTLRYSEVFSEKKRQKNLADFSDIEHIALKILRDEKDKMPTDIAKDMSGFYDEIMIDEYQDSNYIQEQILTAISTTNADGANNIFMVGDVKQSIYSFRMARPDLFIQKYNTYSLEDSPNQKILLGKNFRSRAEVIDCVNHIFESIMHKDIGNVEYDKAAALYIGSKFPSCIRENEFAPSLLLFDSQDTSGVELKRMEARMIARRIRVMVGRQMVTDGDTLRPMRLTDVVILLKAVKNNADIYVEELIKNGVPAISPVKSGYFQSLEVKVILSMLRLIDNAKSDIPLASVLYSPIVGVSEDELAKIKIEFPKLPFYDAVYKYKEEGEDKLLKAKLVAFYKMIDELVVMREYLPLSELIWQVYKKSGYYEYAASLPAGQVREANLKLLVKVATEYEKSSYKSLYRFIDYIDKLQKSEVEMEQSQQMVAEDVVRVMTIHKSKGLEFPVVFVSALGAKFDTRDRTGDLLMHPELYMAMERYDLSNRYRVSTALKNAISARIAIDGQGEAMRLLYVALTRAKDKLILTGSINKAQNVVEQACDADEFTFVERAKAGSFLAWIIRPFAQKYPQNIEVFTSDDLPQETYDVEKETKERRDDKIDDSCSEYEEIIKDLEFVYPYDEDKPLKTKLSVSEIKRLTLSLEDDEEDHLIEHSDSYVPQFIKAKDENTQGTRYGTMMHRFLQCFEFKSLVDDVSREYVVQIANQMKEKKLIDDEIIKGISFDAIAKFLSSDTAKRMRRAAQQNLLFKEQPYVMADKACNIIDSKSNENILIQGIIDVYWQEDDKLILLDYKTDRVDDRQKLVDKYKKQIELYEMALNRARNMEVADKIIYSFSLREAIHI